MVIVFFVGIIILIFLKKVGFIGWGLCVFLFVLMSIFMVYIMFVFNNMVWLNGFFYWDFEFVE